MFPSRARIDINLDDLLHNLQQIRSRVAAETPIMAVVKDNAYGCGARPVAKTLEDAGVSFFAVARMSEACDLRKTGIWSSILCLGNCTRDELQWASQNSIRLAVNDISFLQDLRHAPPDAKVYLHINIDTGMGRLGITPDQAAEAVEAIRNAGPLVEFEGVYTHFACADEQDTQTVDHQYHLFRNVLQTFRETGFTPRYIHSPNSATALRFDLPGAHLIRPGIALYGCKPDPHQDFAIDLRPIAALSSSVVKVKRVTKGTPVSYGAHYHAPADTTIATVALGYAHGLPRLLSNRGQVLINGKRYPIAGNVTMDYIMVDVGDDSVRIGDEVVAWGRQKDALISPDEIARMCSTIGYEILCGMSRSVDRNYWRNQSNVYTLQAEMF